MLIAFVPVLHKGYLELFTKHPGELGILGEEIIRDYTSLTRDLRVVNPLLMKKAIEALGLVSSVRVLSKADLTDYQGPVVMPDEDVSRDIAEKYFSGREVQFEKIFLRYDRPISTTEFVVPPDRTISTEEMHRELIREALEEAQKSSDWWRQIGAVIVKDGTIVSKAHNHPLPHDLTFEVNGDPRSNFDAGTNPQIYLTIHAEAAAIAKCAKNGTALEGSSVFTSTFPCPNCARLLGESGIKKVYYQKGYSLLDAENILKHFGVEIILVN
jgi:dCMP deaminase